MEYTPGPWHWDSDPVKGDPTGRIRYRVTALGKTITQTYYSSFEGGPTNAEADTRLIAAAPELLEALRACIGALGPIEESEPTADNPATRALKKAHAAIAKASPASRT